MAQPRSTGARDLVITYIKGEGNLLKFWALPHSALDTVKTFESRFLKKSNELESAPSFMRSDQIPVGSKCVVKSNIKGMWCRARVLAQQGMSNVLVQLMDYGNEEIIPVTYVRNLKDQIFTIPAQAVECILADVIPARGSEWIAEDIRFCEQHLLYNTLSCYVVSEYMKLPIVRVAKKGESEPFVQRLINGGMAFIKEELVPQPPITLPYKINNMDQNTIHLVKVSCIDSVLKFYVQLSAAEMELKHLMDSINSIPPDTLSFVKNPVVNTPCLAQMTTKPCYYRVLITCVQHTKCKVFFVDYGLTELKDFQELRVIPTMFLNLPAQAICCSLSRDVNINIDTDTFRRLVNLEHLECHVLSRAPDFYLVKLILRGQDIMLAPQNYPQQKLNVGTSCDVTISYVNDLTDFYMQLTPFKDQQNAISSTLNSGYNFVPISFTECVQGKPVYVKFSEDNLWYRAQVMKVNHENDIEVFFIDFGNYDNVGISDVRKMTPDMLKFPIQSFKCYLFETPIPTDSKARDDAFDLFSELTTDQVLMAQIRSFTDDSTYGVTLFPKNSTLSVNEILVSSFMSIPSIPVNDVENVYVTSFENANSFFAQLEKLDSGKLAEMQDEINTFYSSARNISNTPKEGNLVCAKFPVDDQFYRAKVEKSTDRSCEVFFLDYGNRETIPLVDVHPMDIGFTKYPQFGIKCAFQNCPVTDDELSSLILENSIQVRMVRQEKDRWFVSLTDNFPNNISILKVFKQSESVIPRSIHGTGLAGYQEKSYGKNDLQAPPTNSWRNENRQAPSFNSMTEMRKQPFDDDHNRAEKAVTPPVNNAEDKFIDYGSISIPPNAYRNVYVSHVISPSEFYCQIEEDSPKLQLLMKNIEDAYTCDDDNLNMSNFVVDAPCCSVYEDGVWYRGKIKQIYEDTCGVFFVDYGNTDEVPNSKIKKLQCDLFRLPSQAVQCKSFNISPKGSKWNDDEINAFVNMTLRKSFVAQFVESDSNGVFSVNLVSIGKLEHDVFNKEFVSLGFGRLQDSTKTLVLNSHAASANLTFSVPNVEVGSTKDVVVPYGLTPGEIFCQLKSSSEDFKQMMINLQDYYNNTSEAESLIDRPHHGMICVAQFSLDSAWYRAEIKKVVSNKVLVFYVDYGNCEEVERKKVRCIIQDYTTLPVQAIKCRIRGIKPSGISWIVNDNLGEYFKGVAKCKFVSKEKDYFLVDMVCNQKNVAEQLIGDKLALSDGSIAEVKVAAEPKIQKMPQPGLKLPKRADTLVSGQLVSVIVSYIESPCKFWSQLLDEADILDTLMSEIASKYSSPDVAPMNTDSISVGCYCVAQYYADEAWYRAQITSCQPDGTYEVFFIDYGNIEAVSRSQVRDITEPFVKLPPQCFQCSLKVSPLKTTPEMKVLFQGIVDEAEEITAKVEEVTPEYCTVTLLYDKNEQEVNVGELLFGASGNVQESTGTVEPPQFLPPDVPLGLQDGYVSIVKNPQEFYIQLDGIEDTLADLSAELAEICESSDEILENLCIGYACCAKYSEDGNWYRAELTTVHDSTVDVLFVDYGNVDTVEKNTLRGLTDKHLQIPALAIKCKLNGIVPLTEEWSEAAINTFQQLVEESCLGITFISKDIPATVNITKDDKEIAHCLVDMELANVETCAETDEAYAEDHLAPPLEEPSSLPYDQSYPERKLSGAKFAVKICYVDSCDRFFVMPLELSTELDTVMTTLELLYTSDNAESNPTIPETLEDPKASMPCVAKYSEDEAWYRALITDVDGDNIYVSFVDYGNSEITSIKNLRPITPELVKIPPIAMECSFFGMEAIPGQEAAISAKLEEYFVDEIELEIEVCEVSPYKIKLNHNGDVASMLVQDGLAKEVFVEAFVDNSKIAFVDESSEKVQISKRFFTDIDKIVGFVKFCEIEKDFISFYVVSTDLDNELQNLQQKLQDAYCEAPKNLLDVSCMDFCATKYVEDENWYRAQVLFCEKDKVKVRFIDYGNCETVDRSDIYELLPDFTVEPQFSVKCILFGLKVNKNKEFELQNRLDEYVYHDSVELKLCTFSHAAGDPCITSVICGDMNLSEMILNEKLVSHHYVTNCQLDEKFTAIIEKIECDIFYLFPLHLANERDDFQCKLQESCKDLNILPSDIFCGQLYSAKVNDTWYRVSVMDISNDSITVNLVDFGSSEIVNVSDLVLLPVDFCHHPLFLQPCSIEESEDMYISSLKVKATILCEVAKTNAADQPVKIKVLEVSSVETIGDGVQKDVFEVDKAMDIVSQEGIYGQVRENIEEKECLSAKNIVQGENAESAVDELSADNISENAKPAKEDSLSTNNIEKSDDSELVVEDLSTVNFVGSENTELAKEEECLAADNNAKSEDGELFEDEHLSANNIFKTEDTDLYSNLSEDNKKIEIGIEDLSTGNIVNSVNTEATLEEYLSADDMVESENAETAVAEEYLPENNIKSEISEATIEEEYLSENNILKSEVSELACEEYLSEKNIIKSEISEAAVEEYLSENNILKSEVSELACEEEYLSENNIIKSEISELACEEYLSEKNIIKSEISEAAVEEEYLSENNILKSEVSELACEEEYLSENNIIKSEISEVTVAEEYLPENNIIKSEIPEAAVEEYLYEDNVVKSENAEAAIGDLSVVNIVKNENAITAVKEDCHSLNNIVKSKNAETAVEEGSHSVDNAENEVKEYTEDSLYIDQVEVPVEINENNEISIQKCNVKEFTVDKLSVISAIKVDENRDINEVDVHNTDETIMDVENINKSEISYSNLVSHAINDVEVFELFDTADQESDSPVKIKCVELKYEVEEQDSENTLCKNVENSDVDYVCKQEDNFDDSELNEFVKSIDMDEIEKSFVEEDFSIEDGPKEQAYPNCVQTTDKEVNFSEKEDLKEQSCTVDSLDIQSEEDKELDIDSKNEKAATGENIKADELSQSHKDADFDIDDDLNEQTTHNTGNDELSDQAIYEDGVDSENKESCDKNEVEYSDHCKSDKDSASCEVVKGKNNGTIPEPFQLSGSVPVKICDVAISDGSVIFAVQPLDLQEKLSELKISMQNWYSPDSKCFDDSCETNFCALHYENEWCRGKILQKGEEPLTILLIDCGKCTSVDHSEVKNLDVIHTVFPPFAIWCTFAGVVCSTDKSEAVKEFLTDTDSLKDEDCVVKVLEGGEPYKISLFVNGTSVLNQLLQNGLVTQKLPDMYIEPRSYKAKVSFLNVCPNIVQVFVHLSSFSEEYSSLSKSMQNMYKVENSVSNVHESGMYSTFHNNSWYRGLILSTANQTRVNLVDIGEVVTGCSNMCFLLPEHCLQPAYAIPCHLQISDLFDANSESLLDLLTHKEFLVDVSSDVSATLIDEDLITELKCLTSGNSSESKSPEETEKSKKESSKTEITSTESVSVVKAQEQESSEQIIGYLEERFTAETP